MDRCLQINHVVPWIDRNRSAGWAEGGAESTRRANDVHRSRDGIQTPGHVVINHGSCGRNCDRPGSAGIAVAVSTRGGEPEGIEIDIEGFVHGEGVGVGITAIGLLAGEGALGRDGVGVGLTTRAHRACGRNHTIHPASEQISI